MIRVTVADLVFSPNIELESGSINLDSCVVILWDEANRRFLPIFVGLPSGEAIAQILTETSLTRPMTFQFMSNMLQAANVNLESVKVESLQENTYYAVACLSCDGRVREVDARPSDAIALALTIDAPIYVNEAVIKEAGIKVSPDVESAPTGRGLTEFINKQTKKTEKQQKDREKLPQQSIERNTKAIIEETMKFLFNRD